MQVWIDGKFVEQEQATVSVLSHAVGRGVVVFETLRICETIDGVAISTLQEHLQRFENSLQLLQMDPGYSLEEIARAVKECTRINQVTEGVCKIFCYYPGPAWGSMPAEPTPSLAVACGSNQEFGVETHKHGKPIKLGVSSFRKLDKESVPIKAKVSGYYVGDYLSLLQAKQRGFDTQIMLDEHGNICEGGSFSCFFVKNEVLITPPSHRVLDGTTRKVVLDLAGMLGIETREEDVPADLVHEYQEGFTTGSIKGITPIAQLEDHAMSQCCPGPVTARLMDELKKVYHGEVKEFRHLLTFVD
jgi:branched-chain amino acid aminotransferase